MSSLGTCTSEVSLHALDAPLPLNCYYLLFSACQHVARRLGECFLCCSDPDSVVRRHPSLGLRSGVFSVILPPSLKVWAYSYLLGKGIKCFSIPFSQAQVTLHLCSRTSRLSWPPWAWACVPQERQESRNQVVLYYFPQWLLSPQA